MPITSVLLEFLLHLLGNPAAAAAYNADPEAALATAGLSDLCEDDVDSVLPIILDSAPVTQVLGDRQYNLGGTGPVAGGAATAPAIPATPGAVLGDHTAAVQALTNVVNTYSYTSVDNHNTVLDQSVNQNIWADGDVKQSFDNDAVIASGDHAVAAGDDAKVDNSVDNSTTVTAGDDATLGGSTNVENNGSFNSQDDHSVDIDDAFKTDDDVTTTDASDDDIILTDNTDNSEDNSNTDNSSGDDVLVVADVDVDFDDSFNEDSAIDNDDSNIVTDESAVLDESGVLVLP